MSSIENFSSKLVGEILMCFVMEEDHIAYPPFGRFDWIVAIKHLRIHMLHMIAYKYEQSEKELLVKYIEESRILDYVDDENKWWFDLSVNEYVLLPKRCVYEE